MVNVKPLKDLRTKFVQVILIMVVLVAVLFAISSSMATSASNALSKSLSSSSYDSYSSSSYSSSSYSSSYDDDYNNLTSAAAFFSGLAGIAAGIAGVCAFGVVGTSIAIAYKKCEETEEAVAENVSAQNQSSTE